MPGTYAELQVRYGLGDDPYEPLSNIMAGTAYIREMYDRYGAPGFLAAYNAGPRRLEDYLGGGRDLPDETVNYVAAIAPRLGPSTPMSGPLAVYAGNGVPVAVAAVAATPRDACDPDAAYDPTRTCAAGGWQGPVAAPVVAAVPAPVTAPPAPSALPSLAAGDPCDPDAAYDPTRPCVVPARGPVAQEALAAPRTLPPAPPPPAPPSPFRPTLAAGRVDAASALGRGWAVQVGAFSTTVTARMAADRARTAAPAPLQRARLELSSIERHGSGLLYRARLTGLTADEASGACASLSRSGLACAIIRPDAERSW
jgi:hypothetical protein